MILQMDVGNTRIKWRWLDKPDGWVIGRGHGLFRELSVPDQGRVERIELACVCAESQRDEVLRACAESFPSVPRVEAHSLERLGALRNSYSRPQDMGVDRWLAMLEAYYRFPGGVAVVDAGTAVTVDYVAPDGRHLGGYILPGRQLMARALEQGTARVLFQSNDEDYRPVPGQSTQECVMAGQSWLCQALMDKVVADARYQGLATLVVAGGDASHYLGDAEAVHCPDLVFDGLTRYCALTDAGVSNG